MAWSFSAGVSAIPSWTRYRSGGSFLADGRKEGMRLYAHLEDVPLIVIGQVRILNAKHLLAVEDPPVLIG
jgi:hypothetical protein